MTSKRGNSFLDSDSEEEETKPKKKVSFLDGSDEEEEEKPKPKKKVSFLDDDDEEEDEPKPKKKVSFLDDDDEEEEKPKPKKKVSFLDDDDEDEGESVHGYSAAGSKISSSGFLSDDDDEEGEEGEGGMVPESYLSESEEEEEDEDDLSEEEEGEDDGKSWFMSHGGEDEDEEEEEERRVKTQAEKCYDELDHVYEQISQHAFEINCQYVFNDFEALQKVYAKYDGVPGVVYPPKMYLFALIEVGNFIADTESDPESKRIASSGLFQKLKQRFNKACSPFTDQLKQYREDIENKKEEGKPQYDPATCSVPTQVESTEEEQKEPAEKKILTQEDIGKELDEISKEIGKKEFNMIDSATRLSYLAENAQTPQLKLLIYVMRLRLLISHFRSMVPPPQFMPVIFWKQQVSTLEGIFELCEKNENLSVIEAGEDSFEVIIQEALDSGKEKTEEAKEKPAEPPKNYVIAYNLGLVLETLDEELVKSLRKLDFHKFEYVSRVKDELEFVDLAKSALKFYQHRNELFNAAKVAVQLIQHVYFRIEAPSDKGELTKSVADWTKIVLLHGDERMKMRSVLAQIYQHAVNDRFFEARDLLLKTHLQDVIAQTDISTQILFNRALAQLGLAAFRAGMMQEARNCLFDIYCSQFSHKILGQSLFKDKDKDKDKDSKTRPTIEDEQRLVPHHMRINYDMIEVAVLVSTMLEEIPAYVANPKRKEPAVARPFWKHYRMSQNNEVCGPPQSTRDCIIAAAKRLQVGDWRGCFSFIEGLGVWKLIHEHTSKMLREKLKQLIKEEGLRTTLFAHSAFFQSIKISDLVEYYEMPEEQVRSIISEMILTNELQASIDQPSGTLVPIHLEPSKLQSLSRELAEKTKGLVESSERIMDARTNCYGMKTDKNSQSEQVTTGGIWSRQPQQKKQQQQQQQQQQRRMQQIGKGRSPAMQRSGGRDHRKH